LEAVPRDDRDVTAIVERPAHHLAHCRLDPDQGRPALEGNLLGHRLKPAGDGRGDGFPEASPGAERVIDRRRLIAAVHHAIAALRIATAPAVLLPPRRLE